MLDIKFIIFPISSFIKLNCLCVNTQTEKLKKLIHNKNSKILKSEI